MVDNSLLLLAVKRSIALGKGALKGGNQFSSLYGISSLEVDRVDINSMNGYIDFLVADCVQKLPASLKGYKSTIIENLRDSQYFESYAWGEESNMVCNTFYDNSIGKIAFYVYQFMPLNKNEIDAETMSIDLSFRLADVAVTVTKAKKRLFGGTRTWKEIRYIKPAVKFVDFVNALAIVIAPLLDTSLQVSAPQGLAQELKAQASAVPNTMPSDAPRRTVYNPITQTNVVVTDESVLKLLPGKWEVVTSEQVLEEANLERTNWDFDN